MKKLLAFLMLIPILAGACSTFAPSPTLPTLDATPASPFGNEAGPVTESAPTGIQLGQTVAAPAECRNSWYPVKNDAWWMYTLSDGSKPSYTMFASGDNTFTVITQNVNSTFTLKGQCTEAGIILLDASVVSPIYSEGNGNSTLTAQNVEGVTLPNNVQAGETWSQTINLLSTNLTATFTTSSKAVGYETITVPAGTFYALKIEQNGALNMAGQVSNTHAFVWYAQDVGIVKSLRDGTPTSELFAYNFP